MLTLFFIMAADIGEGGGGTMLRGYDAERVFKVSRFQGFQGFQGFKVSRSINVFKVFKEN